MKEKSINYFIYFAIFLALNFSASAQNFFEIWNWNDLVEVRDKTASGNLGDYDEYHLMQNLDAAGASAVHDPDYGWLPIGTAEHPFTAIFDGKGFFIEGIWINRPTDDNAYDNQGLFGVLSGATIKNLGVIIPSKHCVTGGDLIGATNVGGIAGLMIEGSSIENCYATGAGHVKGFTNAGGLVGASDNTSTISDSYAYICKIEVEEGNIGRVISDDAQGGLSGNYGNEFMLLVQAGVQIPAEKRTGDGKDGEDIPVFGCIECDGCPILDNDCSTSVITVTYTPDNTLTCAPSSFITATITIFGDAGTYTFAWSGGFVDPELGTNNTTIAYFNRAGEYYVDVIDNTVVPACSVRVPITINPPVYINPDDIVFNISEPHIDCSNAASGIVISVTENPDWTYSWKLDDKSVAPVTGMPKNSILIKPGPGLEFGDEATLTVTVAGPNGCETTKDIIITKHLDIIPPTVESVQEFCEGATVADLKAHGINVVWYSYEGDLITNHATPLKDDEIYYAAQKSPDGVCESELRSYVKVRIVKPAEMKAPEIANQIIPDCLTGGTIADIFPDMNHIVWYTEAGDQVSAQDAIIPGTYYAAYSYGVCESPKSLAVSFEIGTPPAPEVGGSIQFFCEGAMLANIKTDGTVIWLDDNGDELDPATILVHGATYRAVKDYGCALSDYAEVKIVLGEGAEKPILIGPTIFCGAAPIRDIEVHGYGIAWYLYEEGGSPLSIYFVVAKDTVLWIEQRGNPNCESTKRLPVNISVIPIDYEDLSDPDAICEGELLTLPPLPAGMPTDGEWLIDNIPFDPTTPLTAAYNGKSLTYCFTIPICGRICRGATVTVYALPNATITSTAPDNVLTCTINNQGGITLSVSSCTDCTYTWSTGETTNTINVTEGSFAAGETSKTFTVTVSKDGCTSTNNITITTDMTPPTVTISSSSTDNVIGCTGTITLEATTANCGESCSYSWSPAGGTGSSITLNQSSPEGTYSVTVTGDNGCTQISNTINVTKNIQTITTSLNATYELPCAPAEVVVTPTINPATATTGTYTYTWGGTAPGTIAIDNSTFTATGTGTVTLYVTDGAGCVSNTATATITQGTAPADRPYIYTPNTTVIDCANETITVEVEACTGCTYRWIKSSDTPTEVGDARILDITEAGSYRLEVTGANGCLLSKDWITITENKVPPTNTVTNNTATTVLTCTTPAIVLSSNCDACTYLWSNGATTRQISVTQAGTYSVALTGANGCTSNSESIEITENKTTPTISMDPSYTLDCYTPTTGLQLTPTASCPPADCPVTWSPTSVINGLVPYNFAGGNVTATITNPANGCTASATTNIIVNKTNPILSLAPNQETQLNCTNDREIELTVLGCNSCGFVWKKGADVIPSETGATITINEVGTYTVTATASNGCSGELEFEITADMELPITGITPSSGVISCTNPSVTLTADCTDCTYQWFNEGLQIGSTRQITVTEEGEYELRLVGANGCSASDNVGSVTVTGDATPLTVSIDPATYTVTCTNQPFQSTFTVTPACADCTYNWDVAGTKTGNTISVYGFDMTDRTTIGVTVTDAAGCSGTATVAITDNTTPIDPGDITVSVSTITCLPGEMSATLSVPTGYASYYWLPGEQTSNSITVTAGGSYSVTVRDVNGCLTQKYTYVAENTTPPTNVTITPNGGVLGCEPNNSVTLSVTQEYTTYRWYKQGTADHIGTNATLTVTEPGTYYVTVAGENGCAANSGSVTVTENRDLPNMGEEETEISLTCKEDETSANLRVPSGYSYVWEKDDEVIEEATGNSLTVDEAGVYTVTVTNPTNGCSDTKTFTVTDIRLEPTVTVTPESGKITCLEDEDEITLTATVEDCDDCIIEYDWSIDDTTILEERNGEATITVTKEDIYQTGSYITVTITDETTGCTATATATITKDTDVEYTFEDKEYEVGCNESITLEITDLCEDCTYKWLRNDEELGEDVLGENEEITIDITDFDITSDPIEDIKIILEVTNPENGCVDTKEITIKANFEKPDLEELEIEGGDITCDDEEVTISITGECEGCTYEWNVMDDETNKPLTTKSITVSEAGTYSVKITGANGCEADDELEIEIEEDNDAPEYELIDDMKTTLCEGSGGVTIGVKEDESHSSYLWDDENGSTGSTITVSESDTYKLTIKGENGCEKEVTITVTGPPRDPDLITSSSGKELNCETDEITLTAAGSPDCYYTWKKGGTAIPDAAGIGFNTLIVTNDEITGAGTYTVDITGCPDEEDDDDGEDDGEEDDEPGSGSGNCPGDTDITITIEGTITATITAATDNREINCTTTSVELTAGECEGCDLEWWRVVEDGDNVLLASETTTYTVDENSFGEDEDSLEIILITKKGSACEETSESITFTKDVTEVEVEFTADRYELFCGTDATVTIIATVTAGTEPFTFVWGGITGTQGTDENANKYTVTGIGTVTLMVTGANGCQSEEISTEVVRPTFGTTITASNGVDLDCNTRSTVLSVGNNPDWVYEWKKGTGLIDDITHSINVTLEDITAGTSATFSVKITDQNTQCDTTLSIIINNNNNTGTVSLGGEYYFRCFDVETGYTITVAEGYDVYLWKIDDVVFTGEGAGTHSITIYEEDITSPGSVTLTITDNTTGCEITGATYILKSTTHPEIEIEVTGGTTITCQDGITLLVECSSSYISKPMAEENYECLFVWEMNGEELIGETGNTLEINQSSFTGNSATFKVIVTDEYNGCTSEDEVTITKTGVPTITINMGGPYVFPCAYYDEPAAEVEITATVGGGGTPPYSYSWNGETPAVEGQYTYTVYNEGPVTLTVTDANGCTAYAEVEVTTPDPEGYITLEITGGNSLTCDLLNSEAGGLVLTATPGYAPYTWGIFMGGEATWESTTGNTITITSITHGWQGFAGITVSVRDENNCLSEMVYQNVYNRTDPPNATISATGTNITCTQNASGVTLSVPTCTGCTFEWKKDGDSFGTNVNPITVLPSDIEGSSATFTVKVTNTYGCFAETTGVTINKNTTPPTVTLDDTTPVIDCNNINDMPTLTATPANCDGCTYVWAINNVTQTGQVANTFTIPSTIANGQVIKVTVTSSNGCTGEATATVTRIENPTATIVSASGTELSCIITSTVLSATTSTCNAPTCNYQWWRGAIETGTDLGSGNTISVTAPDTYFLVVTDGSGCTGNTSVVITQNIVNPTISINQTSATIDCNTSNGTVRLTTTTNCTTGCSYTWKKNGTTILSYSNSYLDVSESDIIEGGYADYTVTVTSANGCSSTETAPVRVNRNTLPPSVTIDVNPILIGCGFEFPLPEFATIPVTAITTDCDAPSTCRYRWYRNGFLISTPPFNNPVYIIGEDFYPQYGDRLWVTVSKDNGCEVTEYVEFLQCSSPIIITGNTEIDCITPSVQLEIDTYTCPQDATCTFTWNISGGTINDDGEGFATVSNITTSPAEVYVTVEVVHSDYTYSAISNSVYITSNTTTPYSTISLPYDNINCNREDITVSVPECGDCTYEWTVGGSDFTGTGAGTNSITLDSESFVGNSATVAVTITNTINHCMAENDTIVYKGLFAPTLTLTPEFPPEITCDIWSGVWVTATAAGGTGNYTFTWLPPSGLSLTGPNTNPNRRILLEEGEYVITIDDGGACGTVSETITIIASNDPVIDFTFSMDEPKINVCLDINTDGVEIAIDPCADCTYEWEIDGVSAGGDEPTLTVLPTDITGGVAVITLTVTNTVTHCTSTEETTITMITGIIPPNVESNQQFCEGATIADLNAQGNGVKWYDATGTEYDDPTALLETGYYYATQTVSGCESTLSSMVYVTIVPETDLAPPAVFDQTLCDEATVADIITDGSNGIIFFTSAGVYVAPDVPLTPGNYYAIYIYGNGVCESTDKTDFTVAIGTPEAPAIDNQDFCPGATIANIIVPNGNIVWYFDESATEPLSPATFLRDGHTYWAAQSGGVCESTRTAVTINLKDGAEPPVVFGPFEFCESIYLREITTTGYGVTWFNSYTGTTTVSLDTELGRGTHIFYIEQQGTDECTTPERTEVKITIGYPIAPTLETDLSFCEDLEGTLTIADLLPQYPYLTWYNADDTPATGLLVNEAIYYATQTVGECTSTDKTAVLVSFLPNEQLPAPDLGDIVLCNGATVADFKALYPNIEIYDAENNPVTGVLTTGTYYAAGVYAGGCESTERKPFTVTIYNDAIPPLNLTAETMCEGATFFGNVRDKYPSYYTWYSNAAGTQELTDNFILATGATTLYFKQNVGGVCTETTLSTLTININNDIIVDAPKALSPRYFCETKLVGQLNIEGYNVTVYYDEGLSNEAFLDDVIPFGTHTYYAVQRGYDDCESAVLEIHVTVGAPIAPTLLTDLTFCEDASLTVADLLPQYAHLIWYDDSGDKLAATDAVVPGVYYASQIIGNCESVDRTAVLVSFLPEDQIQAPHLGNITLCTGATVADLKALYPNVEIYNAAGNPVTGTLTAGTYYASHITPDECESSARNTFTVTLNGTILPLNLAQNMCEGATFYGNVKAKYPSIYTWYSDAAGEIPLKENQIFEEGITTLYFKQNVASCEETTLSTLTVTIGGSIIDSPIAESPQYFCDNTILFGQLNIEGYNVTLYTDAGLTIPVEWDAIIPLGTHTYYAVQRGIGECESTRALPITVIISMPIAPTISTDKSFCYDAEGLALVSNLTPQGANISWYFNDELLIGTEILEEGIYYASQTIAGCESKDKTAVLVSFLHGDKLPAPELNNVVLCDEAHTVADLKTLYPNVKIYESLVATSEYTGTLVNGETYYVSSAYTLGDCESKERKPFTVTILSGTTGMPALDPLQLCEGATFFGNVKVKYPNYYKWYSDAAGTTEVTNDFTFATGATTLYVKRDIPGDCMEDMLTSLQINIDEENTTPPTYLERQFCGTLLVGHLDIEGYNVKVYRNSDLTGEVQLDEEITVGDHTYYAVQYGHEGCVSAAPLVINITVSESADAIEIEAEDKEICIHTSTDLEATLVGTSTITNPVFYWYETETATTPLGTTLLGETFNTGILDETTDFYISVMGDDYCETEIGSRTKATVTVIQVPATIVISEPEIVCEGTPVTFTSTITNGGDTPLYQWLVNGTTAPGASTGATYTYTPKDGDVVTAALTSSLACVYPNPLTSNEVELTVLDYPAPPTVITGTLDAYPGKDVDLMDAVLNPDPELTYTFYANANKTGKITGSVVTYIYPKDDYYVTASNGDCEGDISRIRLKIPCEEFTYDDEGNKYKVTALAGFCWTENLRTKIAPCTGEEIEYAHPYTCAGCPDDLDDTYGLLYSWESAFCSEEDPDGDHRRGICPEGYHLPTAAEWSVLMQFNASQLKSEDYWLVPPGGGTDDFGFDARPAGWYNGTLYRFQDLYGYTGWWACDESEGSTIAKYIYISYYCDEILMEEISKFNELSVRCIMDY